MSLKELMEVKGVEEVKEKDNEKSDAETLQQDGRQTPTAASGSGCWITERPKRFILLPRRAGGPDGWHILDWHVQNA